VIAAPCPSGGRSRAPQPPAMTVCSAQGYVSDDRVVGSCQAGGSPSKPLFYPLIIQQTTAFMLREQEVESRLRVSVSTLRRMRQRGTGPEWVWVGKQIRNPVAGCEQWLEANLGLSVPKHRRAVGRR